MKTAKVLAIVTCCGLMVAGSHRASAQSPISIGGGNAFGKITVNSIISAQQTNNVILSFKGATKDIINLIVFAAHTDGLMTNTTAPSGAQLALTNETVVILLADGKTQWPNTNIDFSAFVNFATTGLPITQEKTNSTSATDSDATTTLETIALSIGDTNFEGFVINCLAEEKSTDVINNSKGTETQTYSASLVNGSASGVISLPVFGTIPAVVAGSATIKGKNVTGGP